MRRAAWVRRPSREGRQGVSTTTKERPILFAAEMVRAILAGTKTQTRRVVKLPERDGTPDAIHPDGSGRGWIAWWGGATAEDTARLYPGNEGFPCPFGVPGDRLWVREACIIDGWYDGEDARLPIVVTKDGRGGDRSVLYRADSPYIRAIDDDGHQKYRKDGTEASVGWTPSIHMPRWASRITLEITGVRVERLRGITEADARAEGAPYNNGNPGPLGPTQLVMEAREEFRRTWDGIAKPGETWDANPWVWVVEFKRINGGAK